MKLFRLQIATPDGMKFDGEAERVSVRGICGELAVMAGHVPFVTALAQGECRILTENGEILRARVSGGMLIVARDGVRILSSDFEWSENEKSKKQTESV